MSEASNHSNSNPQPEAKPQMDEALAQSAAQATSDPAAAAVTDPLADAQAELANLKAQNADLADQYLRAQADVQNARRRADDEIAKARKFAVEGFADSLLPVLDSLEAGLAIPNVTIEQIREGSEATLRQLKSALERNKVVEINPPAGTKFDPHTTTKPSAWCPLSKRPTPWSPCCKRVTRSPSASCVPRWSRSRRPNKQKPFLA